MTPIIKDLARLGIGLICFVDKKKKVVKFTLTYNPINISLKHTNAKKPTNAVSRVLFSRFGYDLGEAEAIASANLVDTKTLYEIKLRYLSTNKKGRIYSMQAYLRKILVVNAIKKGLNSTIVF